MSIPVFGLGTFRLQDQIVIDSVSQALTLGYRAIDTAQIYENEAPVVRQSKKVVLIVMNYLLLLRSGLLIYQKTN